MGSHTRREELIASSLQNGGGYEMSSRHHQPVGLGVGADHVNAGGVGRVGNVGGVGDVAEGGGEAQPQLLHLLPEALAEDVVDQRVVDGGALGEQAGQQADPRRDAGAVVEDGPHAHHGVGRPADHEAQADEHGDLRGRKRNAVTHGVGNTGLLMFCVSL
ncbi:hypothetical protein EYF80_049298 [Liparis tanakae]|uniref:Uncharacterized protein n=1 Tax=Liparis tanakae TaxID=230148 RepID=A0A4Z2FH53_9TELE|nr:hypothetical protein EYF80_049298 [Liparis tanakae]